MTLQVLVPVAGRSSFFPEDEFYFPKPLVEVAGLPMVQLVVRGLSSTLKDPRFVFVVREDLVTKFSIDRLLMLAAGPDAEVIVRRGATSGALCSCLLAIDALDLHRPLLISNSDQVLDVDLGRHLDDFLACGATSGVLTFDSVHPRWSYVTSDDGERVASAHEKRVVSRDAIAGLYWFRRAADFVEAAQRVMLSDASKDGTFYISAALNEIILAGGDVRFRRIDSSAYHSFYSPARAEAFAGTEAARALRDDTQRIADVHVVVPAAGQGSRFASAGWKKPKPFLDVGGRPMLSRVLDNVVPPGASATVMIREEHAHALPTLAEALREHRASVTTVPKLTEGTACTVLLARRAFDEDRPLLVANSDQLVDFDVSDFIRDCLARDLDGSILVFRDQARDPKWSFARVDEAGHVQGVAEKVAISDIATVGIYLFRSGTEFVRAAADMIAANDRVNGEFYVCPVYNYLIRNGGRVGVYFVEPDAMHGLGIPADLDAYLERVGAPPSADRPD